VVLAVLGAAVEGSSSSAANGTPLVAQAGGDTGLTPHSSSGTPRSTAMRRATAVAT
jgi:hypothetical protein